MLYDKVINYFSSRDLSREKIPEEMARQGVNLLLETLYDSDIIVIDKDTEITPTFKGIKDLSKLQIPFDNFFLEMRWQDLNYGLHVTVHVRKLDIIIFMEKDNEMIPIMFDIDLDKLPRIYIGCPSRCNKFNPTKPGPLGSVQCMRTPNNADLCGIGGAVIASIMFLIDVINYINKKPECIIKEATTPPPLKRSGRTYFKPNNRYIYINKSPTLYIGQTGEKLKGSKKSPHERRGHYRYYKNGKVVWVKSTKVNGGESTSKIYKI